LRDSAIGHSALTAKALFLDRDGVINVDKNYVHRIEDFEFVDGIFPLCKLARSLGFTLLIVTNQAGIGRGYYDLADFERLTSWMLGCFARRGISIARVYYCPFHPTAGIGAYRRDSYDRKPRPGMILRAQRDFGLDLAESLLVGDKEGDVEAGRAAGVKYNLRLLADVENNDNARLEFGSLGDVQDWLMRRAP